MTDQQFKKISNDLHAIRSNVGCIAVIIALPIIIAIIIAIFGVGVFSSL